MCTCRCLNPPHFSVLLLYGNVSRLVLFYGVFFFGDIARDNWVKRFMRDQLHYKVPIHTKHLHILIVAQSATLLHRAQALAAPMV